MVKSETLSQLRHNQHLVVQAENKRKGKILIGVGVAMIFASFSLFNVAKGNESNAVLFGLIGFGVMIATTLFTKPE